MRFQPPSYITFCLSVSLVLFVAQGIDGRSASYTTVEAAAQKVESIPIPGMKAFPESITSTTDGTLYVGRVGDGGIVRVKPRTAESTIFIQPGASGSRSILGVFADQTSSTLWAYSNDLSALGGPATSNDTGSALKGFDLKTGDGKRSVLLPGSHAFCNDITVDAKGSVYITDSAADSLVDGLPASRLTSTLRVGTGTDRVRISEPLTPSFRVVSIRDAHNFSGRAIRFVSNRH